MACGEGRQGDFTVIQHAVDAAENGDIIEIGPGRFDDYVTHYPSPYYDVYVDIQGKSLELHGAGVGNTIIGPEDLNHNESPSCLLAKYGSPCDIIISGISFENANDQAIVLQGGYTDIVNCGFYGDSINHSEVVGIVASGEINSHVRECTFSGFNTGLSIHGQDAQEDL